METKHRSLVRSSMLVAVTSTVLPVTLANADTTYFGDAASFDDRWTPGRAKRPRSCVPAS